MSWLKNRLGEPSTWAGLGAGLGTVAAMLPPPWNGIAAAAAGLCSSVAVAMKSRSSPDHPDS